MKQKTLHNISYGLYILTSKIDDKENASIINTVIQSSSDPLTITFSLNKNNYSHEIISKTHKCVISIISEDIPFEIIKLFGYQSGKDIDKLFNFKYKDYCLNNIPYINKYTNGYIGLDVNQIIDLKSHSLFICSINEMKILNNNKSLTYEYYFINIKPKLIINNSNDKKVIYRCSVCGYEYIGNDLPSDFVCPICKHDASYFEKIVK